MQVRYMRRIKGEYYTQEDQYTSQDGQIPNVRVYNITESISTRMHVVIFQLDFLYMHLCCLGVFVPNLLIYFTHCNLFCM